jgi:hypothetical protein
MDEIRSNPEIPLYRGVVAKQTGCFFHARMVTNRHGAIIRKLPSRRADCVCFILGSEKGNEAMDGFYFVRCDTPSNFPF